MRGTVLAYLRNWQTGSISSYVNYVTCVAINSAYCLVDTYFFYFAVRSNMSLMSAALAGEIDKIKELITQGADVNLADEDGLTPIHNAVKNVSVDYDVLHRNNSH